MDFVVTRLPPAPLTIAEAQASSYKDFWFIIAAGSDGETEIHAGESTDRTSVEQLC
jgi:hypothetical protein